MQYALMFYICHHIKYQPAKRNIYHTKREKWQFSSEMMYYFYVADWFA